jgi:hypothetical protein
MKVDKLTACRTFDSTERLEAPLCQRPYVWEGKKLASDVGSYPRAFCETLSRLACQTVLSRSNRLGSTGDGNGQGTR